MWFDLTAGDGAVDVAAGEVWTQNCSPGIFAHHARRSLKPLTVRLYEVKANVFERLVENCARQLPDLGYTDWGDGLWYFGDHVRIELHRGDGSEAPLDLVRPGTAVFASNDPNSIGTWAMRPAFAREVHGITGWYQSISTMGCNVGGGFRQEREKRDQWFAHIERQRANMPPHHDLVLAGIDRDASRWGYLLCVAHRWVDRAFQDVNVSFAQHTMKTAALGRDPNRFRDLQEWLFLTNEERTHGSQGSLFDEGETA